MLGNVHIPTEGTSAQSKLLLTRNVILEPNVIFSFSLFPLSFLNSAQPAKGEKGKSVFESK